MSATAGAARSSTRPGRTAAFVGLAMVVAILAGLLSYEALNAIRTSTEGRRATQTLKITQLPVSPTHLVAFLDRTGAPSSLVMVAPSSSGGGSLVLVPGSSFVAGVNGAPPTRLSDAYARAGATEFANIVGHHLGVTFNDFSTIDETGLTSLLGPVGTVEVTFGQPVVDTDDGHSDRVLFPAGNLSLSPAEMAEALLARSAGEPEATRTARVEALWNAIAGTAATRKPAVWTAGSVAGDLLVPILQGPVAVHRLRTLPVTDPVRNPAKTDLVDIDVVDARLVMAQTVPGAVSVASNSLRVELVDPFNDEALVRDAVTLLTFLGVYVVFIHETTEPAPERSTVAYASANTRPAAEFLVTNMQTGPSQQSTAPVENVDATVVLGQDFAQGFRARSATTTSTTAATVSVPTNP